MPKLVLAASLVAVLVLAACGAGPTTSTAPGGSPPPAPSVPASVSPTADPSSVPPATPAPTATPAPSTPPVATPDPTPTPKPTPIVLKVEEVYLLAGVRKGLTDCVAVREGLPKDTTGAIECSADDPSVAKVGFYLFDGSAAALEAYYARFRAEGVPLNQGTCIDGTGEGEGPYIPGPDDADSRVGCFVNDQGFANLRVTVPGLLLYVGVLGRTSDTKALERFTFLGNQDVPGSPTLWVEPENY